MSREKTLKVLEMLEEGSLSWEDWARETLCYLSEDQVAEIAHTLELFSDEDEDEVEDASHGWMREVDNFWKDYHQLLHDEADDDN
jgi:hypothetical protein